MHHAKTTRVLLLIVKNVTAVFWNTIIQVAQNWRTSVCAPLQFAKVILDTVAVSENDIVLRYLHDPATWHVLQPFIYVRLDTTEEDVHRGIVVQFDRSELATFWR